MHRPFTNFGALGIVGRAPVAPAWTPANITTLAWYDANDADTITESAGAVSQWNDKSGNGRYVSQGTGSAQPTYTAGQIAFNGTTHYLFNTSPFLYSNGEFDIYAVCAGLRSGFHEVISEGNSGNSTVVVWPFEMGDNAACEGYYRNDTGTAIIDHPQTSPANVWDDTKRIFNMRDTGSVLSGRTNGGSETTHSYTRIGTFTLNRFAVGCGLRNTAGVFANVDINEIVITNNLSDDDREKMEGYLAHKWGLESDLPALHPYKTEAPTA